jgi:transglutaminase-like putative cysteine protease
MNKTSLCRCVRLAPLIFASAFPLIGSAHPEPVYEHSGTLANAQIPDDTEARDEQERLQLSKDDLAVVALPADFNPVHSVLYFRQLVADRYDGKHTMLLNNESLEPENAWPYLSAFHPIPVRDVRYRQTLSYTLRVYDKTTQPLLMDGSEIIERIGDGVFRITAQVLDHKRPAIFRQLLAAPAGFEDAADAKRYQRAPDDPRVRQLAETALRAYALDERGIRSDYLKALCMSRWLTEHGALNVRRQFDVMALFDNPIAGNAIQFAEAAALMMRSIGLPSRVAYGYAVPVPEQQTQTALYIPHNNFGIWPEVHILGIGWLPLQVCPPTYDKERDVQARGDIPPCY